MPISSERLEGTSTPSGWVIGKLAARSPDATGGYFSHGYHTTNRDGREGFLKAFDISRIWTKSNPMQEMEKIATEFNFECSLLKICNEKGLDRIVVAVETGYIDDPDPNQISKIPYIIFERAEGDMRSQISKSKQFDSAGRLRVLHQITVGLNQLHRQQIAHQDLKPSNVLMFHVNGARIGDLGQASMHSGKSAPHDDWPWAGATAYAPPELLYGHQDPNWYIRRQACDAYHLGSMISFMFSGMITTAQLIQEIPADKRPRVWSGTYLDVLPIVQLAFSNAISKIKAEIDPGLRDELTPMIVNLCDPDPLRRGHPANLRSAPVQYSLDRYVTKFDLLTRQAGAGKFGQVR